MVDSASPVGIRACLASTSFVRFGWIFAWYQWVFLWFQYGFDWFRLVSTARDS